MMWVAYLAIAVLFVILAHRFVSGRMPYDGCDCPECIRRQNDGQ